MSEGAPGGRSGRPPGGRGDALGAAILTGLPGVVTLALAVGLRAGLPLSALAAGVAGGALLATAAALFAGAARALGAGLAGGVAPRCPALVVHGPYRRVRHPVSLALVLGLLGAAVVARSAVGLFATLALFLPLQVLRARMEEELLARRFGEDWRRYAARTGFLLPALGRRRAP